MSNVIDWNHLNEKPLYEQIKEKLNNFKRIDELYIEENYEPDEIETELEYLEDDYNLHNSKLNFIEKLSEKNNINMLAKIDLLDNLSEKQRLLMMLSYGVLVDYFKKINERTDDEIFMLSASSSYLDLEDYTYYIGILSDKEVASSIVAKTNNLGEQVDIATEAMKLQDEFPYDYIDADNYDELVNNCLQFVESYSKENVK